MSSSGLSPQARRLRTIIVALPIMGATSFVLYRRLVLGEPRRTLPDPHSSSDDPNSRTRILEVKHIDPHTAPRVGAGSTGGRDDEA